MTQQSWSERRRYLRDECDDSTGDRFFEAVIGCICFAGIVAIVVCKLVG